MKCPLLTVKEISPECLKDYPGGDCLKEECAWWDDTLKTCAISRIANRLDQMTYFLAKREEREGGE